MIKLWGSSLKANLVASPILEFMSFNQNGTISLLNGKTLKLVDQYIYLGNNISSTKSDVNIHIE